MTTLTTAAAKVIAQRAPGFTPKVGIILGSGLGGFANQIVNPIRISYSELPNFPVSTVHGHEGCLVLGELSGMPVACYQGRVHGYEGASKEDFKNFIRTLKVIGCEMLLITNSSGSLRPEVGPGELVLIRDHINFNPINPLLGDNEEEFGQRFVPMDDAYDKHMRERFHEMAKKLNINLTEGVYFGVSGPCFETPAEIHAFRILGGEVIGMSTVPEVLVARHCGLRVSVVSVITNYAVGLSVEQITHDVTLRGGKESTAKLTNLLTGFVESLQNAPC